MQHFDHGAAVEIARARAVPLLIAQAGGRVTDLAGGDLLAGPGTMLASNGEIHDYLLGLVRDLPTRRPPGEVPVPPCGVVQVRRVRVGGNPPVELHVRERPGSDRHALLVVHGGPDWDAGYLVEPLIRLPDRHRILWPDLRGCGRSSRGLGDEHYTWAAAADDLVALLDRLELGTVDLLGFSAGGRVALRVVLRVPDRVRRLIVASSSVEPVPADALAGWAERDRRRAAVPEVDAGLDGPERTRAWAVAAGGTDVWRADALPGYLRRLDEVCFSGEWARPWLAGRLGAALPDDARRRLAATGIPVLLLHGRQDMTFPAELADVTAAAMPTARACVLDDAGHMAHVDQPERWLAAVEAFLA